MTPFDLILWAAAVLVAVVILAREAMVVVALALEFRTRWRRGA